jgi:cell division topological specificity factor
MNVFNVFNAFNTFSFLRPRRETAPVARERLQIMLAHERADCRQPDLLNVLREDILAVIARHVKVENNNVQVKMDRGDAVSTLEIDVEIPNGAVAAVVAPRPRVRAPRVSPARRQAQAGA